MGRIGLVVVLAAVVFDGSAFRLGGWERAGGVGRDRPKSRSPAGWPIGARRGPP
ncbi:hypothetical protein [Microbispora catharanthi]|uniref:hypothetical protein n=1 Tax=Microbispora catharanthi TaxID=1712871 RepID=UPI001378E0AB|nr:hypothetical protein [Microbispora catharanthi]